jgi:hypothetical protein
VLDNLVAFEDIRNLRFERRRPVGADALWPYLVEAERRAGIWI